jgi:hypothetical protein
VTASRSVSGPISRPASSPSTPLIWANNSRPARCVRLGSPCFAASRSQIPTANFHVLSLDYALSGQADPRLDRRLPPRGVDLGHLTVTKSSTPKTGDPPLHYCQSCEQPTAMQPGGGYAICPSCGRRDDTASLQPLFVIAGASGSGKTTLFGPLARLLAGRCLVFDVDWLIDASSAISGATTVAEIPWDGFAQAWLAVSHGVAQSGLPTVLLGTLTPAGLEANVGRKY